MNEKIYVIRKKRIITLTKDEEFAKKYCKYKNSLPTANPFYTYYYEEVPDDDNTDVETTEGFLFTFKVKMIDETNYMMKDIDSLEYEIMSQYNHPHMSIQKFVDEFNNTCKIIKCFIPSSDSSYIKAVYDLKALMKENGYILI